MTHGSPTVLRILLGGQLRRLREDSGITRDDAGEVIRGSGSKISRVELGRVGFKVRDVADLLTLYGVTGAREREALLELARRANEPGWWHRYGDLLPPGFEPYVGLEEAASALRVHETRWVPDLLQTEDYGRTVISVSHPTASAEEVERRVSMLMRRQELLARQRSPQVWVVIDEPALRRRIGDDDVMAAQLSALLAAIEARRAVVQVVRPVHSAIAASIGPFTLLRFAEPALPSIVYLEHQTSALYLDKQPDLEVYQRCWDRLSVNAEPPAATPAILTRLLDNLR
ncbi:helix-turn-helix domain-containing protein [Spirillospora sp. NPDC048911]|uniref:helix-turn-helix domain-containing protein n=1 Tax=Spirillospora sp. NPDC048911 TaxID=3364527 RepID=UPI003714416F